MFPCFSSVVDNRFKSRNHPEPSWQNLSAWPDRAWHISSHALIIICDNVNFLKWKQYSKSLFTRCEKVEKKKPLWKPTAFYTVHNGALLFNYLGMTEAFTALLHSVLKCWNDRLVITNQIREEFTCSQCRSQSSLAILDVTSLSNLPGKLAKDSITVGFKASILCSVG